MDKPLEIRTFGGLTIKRGGAAVDGHLPQKARALLVYLACTGREQQRLAMADLLWNEGSSRQLMNRMRVLLTDLRHCLKPYLTITRETVAFQPDSPHWLDVTALERGLADTRSHRDSNGRLTSDGLERLAQILQLYQGDFLQGFYLRDGQGFEEWLVVERERWRLRLLDALHELVEAALIQSKYRLGLAHATRWLELDPFSEAAHRQAMQLYARNGQWAEALHQYERCKAILDRELGLPPATETLDLYRAIKAKQLPPREGVLGVTGQLVTTPLPPFLNRETVPQTPPPIFVGRQQQLVALFDALQRSQKGSGQLRFVIGGAGRGKTMLAREFARQAQSVDPSLLVIYGHGYVHTGQGEPYLPFREALTMLSGEVQAHLGEGLLTRQQAERLWQAMPLTLPALVKQAPNLVGTFVIGPALQERAATFAGEAAEWFKQLRAITVSQARPRLEQPHILSQYTACLKTIAARQPLLLILEDFHWSDPASCNLLFHLSRHLNNSPILIIGTYRPAAIMLNRGEERHPLSGLMDEFKRQHGDIWLDLGRLDEAEGRDFVWAYLDSQPNRLDDGFREVLFQQTGGHPLFTVELVQTMQERGDLQQNEAGYWVAGEKINWQSLPARVEGVIETRIHHLDETLQNILTVAGVEGETFTAEVVARVQGVDDGTVIHQLGYTLDQQHRLVTPQAVERLGPGGQRLSRYRFRHNLFQHYVYHNLIEQERGYLHEAVGTALEELYGEQAGRVAVQLARHFQEAGITGKAVGYLLQAGQQAMGLAAHQEAITHLNRGLALLETLPPDPEHVRQELMLQLLRGHAHVALGGPANPEAKQIFERARALYQQVGEKTPQLFPVLYGLMGFYLVRAELPVARELGEQFLSQAQQLPDAGPLVVAHRMLGSVLTWSGHLTQGLAHLEQSMTLYKPEMEGSIAFAAEQTSPAITRVTMACILAVLGYPEQAHQQAEQALRLAEAQAHPPTIAHVLCFSSMAYELGRDLNRTQRCVEVATALANEHRLRYWQAWAGLMQYTLLIRRGQAEAVVEPMRQVLAMYQATGAGIGVPYNLAMLAEAEAQVGQSEAAMNTLTEALNRVEETGEGWYEAELHRLKGELLLKAEGGRQRDEAVEACFGRAIEIARRQEARSLELRATISLARLWQSQGKTETARQKLTEVYDWFTEGFDAVDLKEARALLEVLEDERLVVSRI